MRRALLLFLALLLWARPLPAIQETPVSILGYADWLVDQGDYYRGIGEYKKVLYYFPAYDKNNWVNFQIGRAYFLGGRFDQALGYLVPLTASAGSDQKLQFLVENWLALAYYENGEYISARRLFAGLALQKQVVKTDYLIYQGLSAASQKDFLAARDIFSQAAVEIPAENKHLYQDFFGKSDLILNRALGQKIKSPFLAALLAVFPGAGHVYLGQFDNALFSFLLVGASAWLAIDGFIKNDTVQAGIFSTIGSGFYAGSIYSAYRQTLKHNQNLGDEEVAGLKREFKLLGFHIRRNLDFH